MSGTCLIVSGGEFTGACYTADYVIACDAGYAHCQRLNMEPDLVIGDFDSLSPDVTLPANTVRHPIRKDDTDTMLAVREALRLGYRHLIITCAMGGRFDHTLANLQTAAFAVENGADCKLIGRGEVITCFSDSAITLEPEPKTSLSVFSLSDESLGVTINGASYELENGTLTNTFPLACSNHFLMGPVTISVKHGMLAVVESSMEHENN